MTMFTQGRLQAYERMMQQTSRHDREDSRDYSREDSIAAKNRSGKNPMPKGGDRHERYPSRA